MPIKLPPGATLVDDEAPVQMKLPPGATLVDDSQPPVAGAGALGLPQPAAHPAVTMTAPTLDDATRVKDSDPFTKKLLQSTVGTIGGAIEHPLNALSGIIPQDYATQYQDAQRLPKPSLSTGIATGLGQAIGTAGLGAAGGELLGRTAPSVGSALRSGADTLDNAAIGTSAGDTEFGANPGRAIAKNRIIGTNPATLAGKVRLVIPEAADTHRAIVAANPGQQQINTGPLVSQPFNDLIDSKTDMRTGIASPSQVTKAGLTRRLLTNVPDEVTGKPTANMRDPYLSPLEATQLKSNIYGMTDYDNPSQAALSNQGLKGAAHNLKIAVDQAVPESVQAGQNLHDLMAAKDILDPQSRFVKLPTSKSGIIDSAATGVMTGGAAAMDATGSGLQRIGRYINAPLLVPPNHNR